jgi:signal transduction histidine kinase
LFAEAVESKHSHLTVRGARHALGYVGHELGTPLAILGDAAVAAIMTTMEALGPAGSDPAQVHRDLVLRARLRRYYERVQENRGATNSALRLAPLVVEAGEGELPMFFEAESVADMVHGAVNQVLFKTRNQQARNSGARVSARATRFRVDVQPSVERLPRVYCDRYLLRQLIVNLIDNAVKYSLPRGARDDDMVITVSGQRVGEESVTLSVQNWGQPVDKENADVIFEAFVRGEKQDRLQAVRGMGLGLYLSRLIATAHRGTLDFRSEDDRDGKALTTFDLRLPRVLPAGSQRFVWTEGRGRLEEAGPA